MQGTEVGQVLLTAAAALFPGSGSVPGADTVDLAPLVERVLDVAPRLREPFQAVVERLRVPDPATELRRLHVDDVAAFSTFASVVTQAYLLDPAVCMAVGYPGQTPMTTRPSAIPDYLENGMLERVVRRSPGPRQPPTSTSA